MLFRTGCSQFDNATSDDGVPSPVAGVNDADDHAWVAPRIVDLDSVVATVHEHVPAITVGIYPNRGSLGRAVRHEGHEVGDMSLQEERDCPC